VVKAKEGRSEVHIPKTISFVGSFIGPFIRPASVEV
jgi:hypothetical protein